MSIPDTGSISQPVMSSDSRDISMITVRVLHCDTEHYSQGKSIRGDAGPGEVGSTPFQDLRMLQVTVDKYYKYVLIVEIQYQHEGKYMQFGDERLKDLAL